MYVGKAFHVEGIRGTKQGCWKEQHMLGKEKFNLLLRGLLRDEAGVTLVKGRQRIAIR